MRRKTCNNKFIIFLMGVSVLFTSIFSVSCNSFMQNLSSLKAETLKVELEESMIEGLNFYSEEEIKNKRVTIRQPQMEILQRGVKRTAPKVMSDTFYLPIPNTRENSNAKVVFDGYPNLQGSKTLTPFQKYMLVRQVRYFNKYAMQDAEAGTLMKHPAADNHYGEIKVENNAVKKKIVLDPDYKSALTTGLYLPAGEIVTVEVKGLKTGERITFSTHPQATGGWANGDETQYFNKYDNMIITESEQENPDYENLPIVLHDHYKGSSTLIPGIAISFSITENRTYKIGAPFGGALMVKCENLTSSPEIIITGAVETPHFILGVTSKDEFEQLKNAPGLIGVVDVENGYLVGPSNYISKSDDIEKVSYLWHSIFAINGSLNGRKYNRDIYVKFNYFIPAGAAVAINNTAVCPSGWMNICMNYQKFLREGSWGVLHEIGHINASAFDCTWGMNGTQEGEVRNNVLIVLAYTMLLDMDSRMVGVEHGFVTHPYLVLKQMLNISGKEDYNNYDYFQALTLYASLIHSFGPEKFIEFLYSHKLQDNKGSAFSANKRADFAYRLAIVNNRNFIPWLNKNFKANITEGMYTSTQLSFLNSLKGYVPIAYRFANGVNENETSRKHEINFYNSTTFDFSGDNILCTENFQILGYDNPKFGSLKEQEESVVYTPPKEIVEYDEFNVNVKITSTNEIVKLPVRFKFKFNNNETKVWENVSFSKLDKAMEFAQTNNFTKTENYNAAGLPEFNRPGIKDYFESTFKYVAPQSGAYKFYLKADDQALAQFGLDKNNLNYSLQINRDTANYNKDNFIEVNLNKGQELFFKTHLLNFGGKGFLKMGVALPSAPNKIVDVPNKDVYGWNTTKADISKVSKFEWKPKFLSSIKNYSKKFLLNKNGWEFLESPNPQNGSDINNLIDGKNNTIFHSKYHPSQGITPMPHVFVLDIKTVNLVNFFEITTRNNVNSYIKNYSLYSSKDNVNYELLSSSETLKYSGQVATINFPTAEARYFKLVVNSTTGGNFTVMSEINIGTVTTVKDVVRPANDFNSFKGFNQSANGELLSNNSGSIFRFSFSGTGFDVFANKGTSYGKANVKIDGKFAGVIDLEGDNKINELVFSINNLSNDEHVVEIETTTKNKFHIGFLNLDYSTNLIKSKPIINAMSILLYVICALASIIAIYLIIVIIKQIIKKKKR